MQNILKKLIEKKDLHQEEMVHVLDHALKEIDPIQVGAFLVLLEAKGVTPDELFWVLEFIESKCDLLKSSFPVLDIVGTGGDHANTFNISTGSAILTAACGVKVAKHGNRSISSNCGSVDVLEALGIEFDLDRADFITCLEEVGITFMPAALFHSTWRALREIRSKLGVRTLLNLAGPLLNPARAHYQLIGVYKPELLDLVAGALFKQGKVGMVVCSHNIDELTPIGPALIKLVTKKGVQTKHLDPKDLGIKKCTLQDLKGSDAASNAKELKEVLKGKKGAWADTLVLNAGAALFIRGVVGTIQEGVDLARKQLENGSAYQKLEDCIAITRDLKAVK